MFTITPQQAIRELRKELDLRFEEYKVAVENDIELEKRMTLRRKMLMTKQEINFVLDEVQKKKIVT